MSTVRQRRKADRPATVRQDAEPDKQAKKVYGKTPGGEVFAIPQTYDVLSGLFDPRLSKSAFDLFILATFAVQLAVFVVVPLRLSRYAFLAYFSFWRLSYNLGLGVALTRQSRSRWIVRQAERYSVFDLQKSPKLAAWIKRQLEARLSGSDYAFSRVPIEFNVWLAFRHIVDVILLNDFLAYALFGVAWLRFPAEQGAWLHVLRWLGGIALIAFNVIVKLDAHRVVKDIAWYWGDCFWITLQDLTFDGVFELAPHPMYSVGYAGYYGLSLISGSRIVFFVSLLAHCSQFLFLALFENPHIERTYGKRKMLATRSPVATRAPSPKQARSPAETPPLTSASDSSTSDFAASEDSENDEESDRRTIVFKDRRKSTTRIGETSQHDLNRLYFHKSLVLFRNWDFFRSADFNYFVVAFYMATMLLTGGLSSKSRFVVLYINALAWRCFHSFGLGVMLRKQSHERWLVRHFLKHYADDNEQCVRQAFANWCGIYNTSLTMTYLSFGLLSAGAFSAPSTMIATFQASLLRYTCGCLLIALHVWVARETYQVLGSFGWFYGDFFIEDYPRSLLYTGIYRFLNNPERIVGGAAFLGMSFISGNPWVAALAVFSIISHIWFLQSVENPHMEALYGAAAIRKQSGFTKAVRNLAGQVVVGRDVSQLADATKGFVRTYEHLVSHTKGTLDGLFQKSGPLLSNYVRGRRDSLLEAREQFVIPRKGNTSGIDTDLYHLSVSGTATFTSTNSPLRFHLGEPIRLRWTAPPNHSSSDWVGIYRKGAAKDRRFTNIASQGRWLGVYPEEWDGDLHSPTHRAQDQEDTEGVLEFKTFNKLPHRTGLYEMRLHHAGKHNVLAISQDIEIYVIKPKDVSKWLDIYSAMRKIVYYSLHGNVVNIPPSLEDLDWSTTQIPGENLDNFTFVDVQQAKQMAYAIKQSTGIELDHEVVLALANVQTIATRIFDARRLLYKS